MGEMAEDIVDGFSCSWCGIYFEKAHGYPVACESCWREALKEYGAKNGFIIGTAVQKAHLKEL